MKTFFAVLLFAMAGSAAAFDHEHRAFTELLAPHVAWNAAGTSSAVDYAGLQRRRGQLQEYLATLSAVDRTTFDNFTLAQRQAFLINAYNAFTLELILTAYPKIESIKDLGSLFSSPWKKPFFRLLGEQRHLDDVEHGLLRGAEDFDEPRIHFAVNCASIGCPALRPEAFTAARFDAQLDDQTVRFLRDRTRNRFDAEEDVLLLSSIFDWYAGDFETGWRGAESVAGFVALYSDALGADAALTARLKAEEIEIDYLDYDWALNGK